MDLRNKVHFISKLIKRDRERQFICIKGKTHQDNVSTLKSSAPKARVPTFVTETLLNLKSYIDPHPWIVGDFNILSSLMDRSSRQKLNREIL